MSADELGAEMEKSSEVVRLPSAEYRSRFEKWDELSWVRSKPHRLDPFDPALQFYSEDLAVLFGHPRVRGATELTRRSLLVLHLYNYLEFTVWLELGPVNEVCDLLRRPDFLPWLPAPMREDALKIYVDEGGHAEMSHSLMAAVKEFTGVDPLKLQPAFLRALDQLVQAEDPIYHCLVKLFFVIISETLITGTLLHLPKDETVQRAVRALAGDHAHDEGRHHAYFRQVFEYVWPRLPREAQWKIGALLPKMCLAFLEPDAAALVQMLKRFPQEFPFPERVVRDVVEHKATRISILKGAQPTLAMLEANGVFEEPIIAEAFRRHELVFGRTGEGSKCRGLPSRARFPQVVSVSKDARSLWDKAALYVQSGDIAGLLEALVSRLPPSLYRSSVGIIFDADASPPSIPPPEGIALRFVDCSEAEKLVASGIRRKVVHRRFESGDRCFGAYRGTELVHVSWIHAGPCLVRDWAYFHSIPEGRYIYGVFTRPEERQKGIYKATISALTMELLREATCITQLVNSGNGVAIHTLESLGYVRRAVLFHRSCFWRSRTVIALCREAVGSLQPTRRTLRGVPLIV